MRVKLVRLLAGFCLMLLASAPVCHSTEVGTKTGVVFFNFYDDNLDFWINGKLAYRGPMTVEKANETTGLSLFQKFLFQKCNNLKVISKSLTYTTRLCLKPTTKLIYISPQKPYISTSNKAMIMLD